MQAVAQPARRSRPRPAGVANGEQPPVIGVSLAWLSTMANAWIRRRVRRPASRGQTAHARRWRERLATSARSATPDAAQAVNGHWVIPALFGDGPGCFTTPFQLVHVKPVGELGKSITRDTKVKVAPVDAKGVAREELAVEATAGELCLRKTRELVYSYIGQGPVPGVTNEKKETYVDSAARALAAAADAYAVATDFVSPTWGDLLRHHRRAHADGRGAVHAFWQPPDFDYSEDVGAFLRVQVLLGRLCGCCCARSTSQYRTRAGRRRARCSRSGRTSTFGSTSGTRTSTL